MKFKHHGSFYSAYSLAQALGIDPHAVTRWIKSGHLKAKFRGTARGPQQNGESYLIQERDVRRFILGHPTDVDLRKVNQIWFLDLIYQRLSAHHLKSINSKLLDSRTSLPFVDRAPSRRQRHNQARERRANFLVSPFSRFPFLEACFAPT